MSTATHWPQIRHFSRQARLFTLKARPFAIAKPGGASARPACRNCRYMLELAMARAVSPLLERSPHRAQPDAGPELSHIYPIPIMLMLWPRPQGASH
jgi:hypothetical protein